jgi:hypothetical protein
MQYDGLCRVLHKSSSMLGAGARHSRLSMLRCTLAAVVQGLAAGKLNKQVVSKFFSLFLFLLFELPGLIGILGRWLTRTVTHESRRVSSSWSIGSSRLWPVTCMCGRAKHAYHMAAM